MIIKYANDGATFENEDHSFEFCLDNKRDIKTDSLIDENSGQKTGEVRDVFNFVGFVSNENNDLMIVGPKNYKFGNLKHDAQVIFQTISKHMQKKPDLYFGEKSNQIYSSNYPFSSFFEVYDYYKKYGMFFDDKVIKKPNVGGRVDWKATISKANKFVDSNNLFLYPLYYRTKHHYSTFITECMIFVIDYTISKFSYFIDYETTGSEFPEFDFMGNTNFVINFLNEIKEQQFKDLSQRLIESLINFFAKVRLGGNFYLKHYSFSSIWEDMIEEYLNRNYSGIDVKKHNIIFDKNKSNDLKFSKRSFHTNSAKPSQYISPDHYSEYNDTQLIFDAKYYSKVVGIDYKQVAYIFMLQNLIDTKTDKKKFLKTYSALILPSDKRSTKIHFSLDRKFGNNDI
ncbi:MAG: hypothetical protein K5986_06640, partial [Clostridium sp.]|nr:hypothetical protein [Clostridium sp.]